MCFEVVQQRRTGLFIQLLLRRWNKMDLTSLWAWMANWVCFLNIYKNSLQSVFYLTSFAWIYESVKECFMHVCFMITLSSFYHTSVHMTQTLNWTYDFSRNFSLMFSPLTSNSYIWRSSLTFSSRKIIKQYRWCIILVPTTLITRKNSAYIVLQGLRRENVFHKSFL